MLGNENLIICQSVGVPLVGTLSYRGNHKGLPLQENGTYLSVGWEKQGVPIKEAVMGTA